MGVSGFCEAEDASVQKGLQMKVPHVDIGEPLSPWDAFAFLYGHVTDSGTSTCFSVMLDTNALHAVVSLQVDDSTVGAVASEIGRQAGLAVSVLNGALFVGSSNTLTHRFLQCGNAPIRTQVVFNIQNHRSEPLLNVADYLCWAVQRVFQKGECRLYDFVRDRVSFVADLYDFENTASGGNRYGRDNPLTERNKISPHLH